MSRSKIFLIKGQYNIAQKITLGEYARINVDHIVLITAIRFPQYLSNPMTPDEILNDPDRVLEDFDIDDQRHLIAAEYANMVVDRGHIEAVEGRSMDVEWLYNTIRAYHKNCGQSVVDIEGLPRRGGTPVKMIIDGVAHTWQEGLERLESQPSLG